MRNDMPNRQLYTEDSYLKSFTAKVLACDGPSNSITLDQTGFYPGGGGQPCDVGYLVYQDGRQAITKVSKIDGEVVHFLEGSLPQAGQEVHCTIDWQRRHQLMRTHTALHILSGVIWRDYQALVTGGNIEPLKGRLDFEFDSINADMAREIEGKINIEVQASREVTARILPREEAFKIPDLIRTKINLLPPALTEIRVVEIVGLDLQADGGTHVRNTSEVGPIRITKHKSKGKTNKRLEIGLEEQASD